MQIEKYKVYMNLNGNCYRCIGFNDFGEPVMQNIESGWTCEVSGVRFVGEDEKIEWMSSAKGRFEKVEFEEYENDGFCNIDMLMNLSTNSIRNMLWMASPTGCCQPVAGCLSIKSLRDELKRRGEIPIGYHHS